MDAEQSPERLTCPECQAGQMHLRYLPYFTWLNEELVTVPDFPAWVCDLCGCREYDGRAVAWLNVLLNPNAGRDSAQRLERKRRPPSGPSLGA